MREVLRYVAERVRHHRRGRFRGTAAGVISDGDLRRLIAKDEGTVSTADAGEAMHRSPVTIEATELASAPLQIMNSVRSLPFRHRRQRSVQGILHIHDLWVWSLF